MAPIYIGTNKVDKIFLGTSKVKSIYLGTNLVYSSSVAGTPILWNAGPVTGVTWKINYLTRPSNYYTGLGRGSIGSNTIWLDIDPTTGNSVQYSTHACTQQLITIPSSATKLWVRVKKDGDPANMRFGLLPTNAPNSMDTSKGGKLDSKRVVSSTSWTDYSLALNSGMAGSSIYRVVVNVYEYANVRSTRDEAKGIGIYRVWFT